MADGRARKPRVYAVCGKGGVGKTSVSASLVQFLLEEKRGKVLAIDADPAVGLATALGFSPKRTVDDIRNDLIGRVGEGEGGDRREILDRLDYEVFEALAERGDLAFLAIGRPEKEGCYCRVNDFLKSIIETTAANFDHVVIDGEAGIEQVNRRVMDRVTHLLLVSDASFKGIQVARAVREVAEKTVSFETAGLVLNRIRGEGEIGRISLPAEIPLLGWLPESDSLRECDIQGRPTADAADPVFDAAVRRCLGAWQ